MLRGLWIYGTSIDRVRSGGSRGPGASWTGNRSSRSCIGGRRSGLQPGTGKRGNPGESAEPASRMVGEGEAHAPQAHRAPSLAGGSAARRARGGLLSRFSRPPVKPARPFFPMLPRFFRFPVPGSRGPMLFRLNRASAPPKLPVPENRGTYTCSRKPRAAWWALSASPRPLFPCRSRTAQGRERVGPEVTRAAGGWRPARAP